MCSRNIVVQNQVGLHSRSATYFINEANKFRSSIWVEKEERKANAKSLLGVLSLGVTGGNDIKIIADGPDDEAAVEALCGLIRSGLIEQ